MYSHAEIRSFFPAISEHPNIIYFDNAASSQKPKQVLDFIQAYNTNGHANIHRGAYRWSVDATEAFEHTRKKVAEFIHAESPEQIIFTSGTTESMNLVAASYGRAVLQKGDRIVVSLLEHHSNFVPWQQLALEKDLILDFLTPDKYGNLHEDDWNKVLTEGVKLLAITMMSNVLGVPTPVQKLISKAHEIGAIAVVDAAQAVQHQEICVQELNADFLAFSAHKCFGLTGTGILYGKKELLEQMIPYQYGGGMFEYVTKEKTTFAPLPAKLEAGTANIDGVIAFSAAIDFMQKIGMDTIRKIERDLTQYALHRLKELEEITIYGDLVVERGPVIAFNVKDVHPHDVASILDADGIAVRAGHHCAQPLMRELSVPSAVRVSFSIYNTKEEIDFFVEKLKGIRRWLGYGS